VPYGFGVVDEDLKARRVLVLLVAAEVAAVVALHRLGGVDGFAIPRHDLARWLQQTPSEDVLLAGVRLAALVAAWWLLGSTLLYVAARVTRLHRTATALGWATLPAVRRWADRAAAVSIVAATALGVGRPVAADPPPTTSSRPAPVVVDADHRDPARLPSRPPSSARTGYGVDPPPVPTVPPVETAPTPPPTTTPLVRPPAPPPTTTPFAPAAPAAPPAAPTAGATHVVTRGEHLWSIAAGRVATAAGKLPADLSPADIAPYWRRVVEINRLRLRSGNANLVHPGEIVELPPLI
jgi:hypothetical protein